MYISRPLMWQKVGFISLTILLCVGAFSSFNFQSSRAQVEREKAETSSEENAAAFVDSGFNPIIGGTSSFVAETVIQPDGKILVGGDFRIINGVNRNGIARFNADGSLDSTFNTGSGANDAVFGMSLQSNGKIIISGLFTNFNGATVGRIARLNADGSLDQTFNTVGVGLNSNAGGNNEISKVEVLSDDKIIIGGTFTNYNGTAQNRLARLNSNGSLDTTFVVGTGANSTVLTIEVQADGKYLIGGNFANYGGTPAQRVARINTDGSIDTGFPTGAGADFTVRTIVIQSDGKILVGGLFVAYAGFPKNGILRLESNGNVDQTFDASGMDATVFGIAVQPDGKIIVGGSFTQIAGGIRQCIARLNANGTFDASFDPGTGIGPNVIQDLALQTDGKVVLVGTFLVYNGVARGGIARANADGSLDTSMPATSSVFGTVNKIAVQSDGKIVIGGLFTSVNGVARANIARLNADGTLDATFDPGTGTNTSVLSMAIQSDGKILVGGTFTTFNGTTVNRIARLNSDGTLDGSFSTGTGVNSDVSAIAIQPSDGKVIIGGAFITYNAVTVNRFARLNTDGTLDTTFMTGTSSNGIVRSIVFQTDNKILIGGQFTTYNATARNRVARINADGTLDTTFNPGTGASNTVSAVALQADGKVLISGVFTTFNAIPRNRIARLNSDGTLDTGFDPGIGPGVGTATEVTQMIPLENGKTLIAGNFTTFNNLPRNRVTRLNANGNLDNTFLNGIGALTTTGAAVRSIVRQVDGKILIGGQFSIFNFNARTGIARFSNVSDAPVDFDGDGKSDFSIIRRPGPIGPWTWWIQESGTGRVSGFDFGLSPRDFPQPGDFDGDGKDDIAMWRDSPQSGSSNAYYIIQSSTNTTRIIPFGLPGDVPVVEDYDGDGKDDPAVWRVDLNNPGQATWFYLGSLNNPNNIITYVPWGIRYGTQQEQADEPYSGDFDGDGRADFAVQRHVDLMGATNSPAGFYVMTASGNISYQSFGLKSDRIVPGDYDGDGKTDICVVRGFNISPSDITWYIRYAGGRPDDAIVFGRGSNFNFTQGDYDGDGATDISLFVGGNFWWRAASSGAVSTYQWGISSDLPVASYNNR